MNCTATEEGYAQRRRGGEFGRARVTSCNSTTHRRPSPKLGSHAENIVLCIAVQFTTRAEALVAAL
jgi:hypothetical protein